MQQHQYGNPHRRVAPSQRAGIILNQWQQYPKEKGGGDYSEKGSYLSLSKSLVPRGTKMATMNNAVA